MNSVKPHQDQSNVLELIGRWCPQLIVEKQVGGKYHWYFRCTTSEDNLRTEDGLNTATEALAQFVSILIEEDQSSIPCTTKGEQTALQVISKWCSNLEIKKLQNSGYYWFHQYGSSKGGFDTPVEALAHFANYIIEQIDEELSNNDD